MPSLPDDLRFRGLIVQVTDEAIFDRLEHDRVTVYAGFDPTAPSLHVGHLLQFCTLRRLQLAGHRPISVAGGATGAVGDPGGKTDERQLLSDETLAANIAALRPQMARFLDLEPSAGPSQGLVVDNADWLRPMGVLTFLRDVGKHFTVNQMVAKESVRSRFERPDQGISYTEFSYMLLQAYDFLRLHVDHGCDLQIGGSEQWGNITMGVELVRKVCREEVFGFTTPLVLKSDGTKFGKTESGTVWLDPARTSPYELYQFFLQADDATVGQYLRYFTFLPHEAIAELDRATAEQPERREAQRALAREVCTLVHGAAETGQAERAAGALFGGGVLDQLDEPTLDAVSKEAPTTTVERTELADGSLELLDVLVRTGLASSRSEARRLVAQRGVYVNLDPVEDSDRRLGAGDLLFGRWVHLRRGPRRVHLLRVE